MFFVTVGILDLTGHPLAVGLKNPAASCEDRDYDWMYTPVSSL